MIILALKIESFNQLIKNDPYLKYDFLVAAFIQVLFTLCCYFIPCYNFSLFLGYTFCEAWWIASLCVLVDQDNYNYIIYCASGLVAI
jgi:hypothetical protein